MMAPQMLAVVIPSQFEHGRWLLCRRNRWGWTTVVSDHCDQASAERERRRLQAEFDAQASRAAYDPNRPQQMVLGFYTDQDAA